MKIAQFTFHSVNWLQKTSQQRHQFGCRWMVGDRLNHQPKPPTKHQHWHVPLVMFVKKTLKMPKNANKKKHAKHSTWHEMRCVCIRYPWYIISHNWRSLDASWGSLLSVERIPNTYSEIFGNLIYVQTSMDSVYISQELIINCWF